MTEIRDELRTAFEERGYDVDDVSVNRDQVRVALRAERAEATAVKPIVYEVVDESAVLGLDVRTETVGGQDTIGTVVSFRHRP